MDYVLSKVRKGLADSDRPSKGKERESWPELVTRFEDKAWKQDGLKRDEKFEMHFSAAVRTSLLDRYTELNRYPISNAPTQQF